MHLCLRTQLTLQYMGVGNRGLTAVTLDGLDPIEVKHQAVAATKLERLRNITFRQAANDFLSTDKVEGFKNDKHRKQWRSTLELAFPVIGDLPLNKSTPR